MSPITDTPFDTVEDALAAIGAGKLVIVTDDENRENEGDLIMAAEMATPETINMMIRYGSGIVCVPTVGPQLRRLGLGPMVSHNRDSYRTDFTVSVDAADGISTGISAFDRARTIRLLAAPTTHPENLVQPGHVFPLRARPGGILERAGHTEAAVELVTMAGLSPFGVLCERVNDDGTVQRLPQLIEFKHKFGLKLISIAALIEYRARREQLVELVTQRPFSSDFGEFVLHLFQSRLDGRHHVALSMGTLEGDPVLVRVHGANVLSDVFNMKGLSGHGLLTESLSLIAQAGRGLVLYMQPENPTEALLGSPETAPCDTKSAMDFRDYGIGAQILHMLGVRKMRLITSNQRKIVGLDGFGLEVVEQIVPGSIA